MIKRNGSNFPTIQKRKDKIFKIKENGKSKKREILDDREKGGVIHCVRVVYYFSTRNYLLLVLKIFVYIYNFLNTDVCDNPLLDFFLLF